MQLTLIEGNVFEQMPKIPSESIDLVLTSPPYWGLRAYGTIPQIFGGKADCQHEFNEETIRGGGHDNTFSASTPHNQGEQKWNSPKEYKHGTCHLCGAWRGEYGNEPTMEAYLDNTMRWVKEVWRVLKPTGSFVLNIGDCFIGGGRGDKPGPASINCNEASSTQGAPSWADLKKAGTRDWKANSTPTSINPKLGGIYKTKQLLSVSSFAYCRIVSETDFVCRGEHIWAKPNVPSPIRSRLKHSHEKLFWFVKDAGRYYFDSKAWMKNIKIGVGGCRHGFGNMALFKENPGIRTDDDGNMVKPRNNTYGKDQSITPGKRGCGMKNINTIESSWRIVPVGAKQNGFELSDRGASEHIAPFPEELIRPYVKSLCPHDGVVLDPFLGSGTTMRVSMEEARSCMGIELNEKYVAYAKKRLNWNAGIGVIYATQP